MIITVKKCSCFVFNVRSSLSEVFMILNYTDSSNAFDAMRRKKKIETLPFNQIVTSGHRKHVAFPHCNYDYFKQFWPFEVKIVDSMSFISLRTKISLVSIQPKRIGTNICTRLINVNIIARKTLVFHYIN